MLTLQTLIQLEEMEKKATPGPWYEHAGDMGNIHISQYADLGGYTREARTNMTLFYLDEERHGNDLANLIISLRNHAPELLAMARYAIEKGYKS